MICYLIPDFHHSKNRILRKCNLDTLHLGILSTRKLEPLIKVVYDMTSELRKTQSFSTFLSAELVTTYNLITYVHTSLELTKVQQKY